MKNKSHSSKYPTAWQVKFRDEWTLQECCNAALPRTMVREIHTLPCLLALLQKLPHSSGTVHGNCNFNLPGGRPKQTWGTPSSGTFSLFSPSCVSSFPGWRTLCPPFLPSAAKTILVVMPCKHHGDAFHSDAMQELSSSSTVVPWRS